MSNIGIIKSRRMRWARHIARMGEIRNAQKNLVGKPRVKREDNIKTNLREIRWEVWTGCMWLNTEKGSRLL
jgi:hypothetical protein